MRRLRLAIVVLALALPAVFAAQAAAVTFTVNTTTDNASAVGECSGVPGDCSLRQAVDKANSAASPSTIIVPAGMYDLGLNSSSGSGPLTIDSNVTITGAGARSTIVDQLSSTPDRVFEIQAPPSAGAPTPPTVTISGLEITGGTAPTSGTNAFFGGDVQNVSSTVTLSEDWITGGTASSGGGVSNRGGSLTLTHSLVAFNTANTGGADSGGIQNYGDTTVGAGRLLVDDSTIANNTSSLGGGIFSWCSGPCSSSGASNTTTVTNSTIAFNDGGGRSINGGGLLTSSGSISVQNTIVAFNTVSNPSAGSASNCGASAPATISSSGHNLETATDCGFTSAGDLQNTDPLFLREPNNQAPALQDNGGNTNTLALQGTSPAVDAIPSNAPGCSGADQRDVLRPQGRGCDIGAYELFQPVEGQQFSEVVGGATGGINGTPTINWGDGTTSSGSVDPTTNRQVTGTHTYAEEGTYHASFTWANSDGSPTTVPFDVRVQDAALNNASGTPVSANAGQPFSGPVATFSDSDPGGTASDYTATINWGDGTTSAGTAGGSGPFTISGTHTYAAGGSYPVSVTIADAGGATTVANTTANVTPQNSPVVFTGPPAVKTSSGAVFSGSVNPLGLPTTAYFQYGLDSSYGAAADGPTYTASTPAQPVGSDFSAHAVSATVSGLVPNAIYHVRLVASNSAGTTYGPDQTFMTSKAPPPGSPTLGKTFNLAPVSGVVLIKVNNTFVPVTELLQIPSNTEIDALHGTVELIAAGGTAQTASSKGHKTQTGKFGGAIFRVAQARSGGSKGQTTLSLVEGAFAGAPTYASCKAKKASDASSPFAQAASLSSSVLQTLHASAHGRFRTRGRYSAATVRGTIWTTVDRCDGTLTSVQKDTVLVTDFVSHKTILLHTGQHYLAKAPTGRHK